MDDTKFLLCKGKAGLGNRLLSAAGSILYAKITGRTLYIDWSDRGYSQDRSNSWPRFFAAPAMPGAAALEAMRRSQSVAPAVWLGYLEHSADELMELSGGDWARDQDPQVNAKYTIGFQRTDYPQDVLVRWSYTDEMFLLRQQLASLGPQGTLGVPREEALLRRVMRDDIALSPELEQRVEEVRAQRFSGVTIGMHIRQSDRKNSFAQYPLLADQLLRRHPGATIFLATDNQDVEAHFRDRFQRVVTTQKWFAPPGTPLHRMRECPDKTEMGAAGLVDMYLLSRCDYLVYNKTTSFGLCASLLSQAPQANRFETSPIYDTAKDLLRWIRRKVTLALPGAR